MKKLIILIVLSFLAVRAFSQIENDVSQAVGSLGRETSFTKNLYLQSQFMAMVRNGENHNDELLDAYHKEGFKRFTKKVYIDGQWESTETIEDDSTFLSVLSEIQKGIPKVINNTPTSVETETLIDDYVTDYWEYTNKEGNKCEMRVYFINGQLRSLGYWLYK